MRKISMFERTRTDHRDPISPVPLSWGQVDLNKIRKRKRSPANKSREDVDSSGH
jgi:hypothetical protein